MDTEPITEPAELVPELPVEEPVVAPPANNTRTWIIAGAATVIALCGAMVGVKALDKPTPVAAQNATATAGFERPTAGKITKIDGSSFTVAAQDFNGATTPVKVSTSKSTKFTESVEGALSDLKKGDTVMVMGETADGVVTATRINQAELLSNRVTSNGNGPPAGLAPSGQAPNGQAFAQAGPANGQFSRGNFTAGEITEVKDGVLTLNSPDGSTVTVKTTTDTKVMVNKTIALKDLTVGDSVRVSGTTTNGAVKATEVRSGAADGPMIFGGPRAAVAQ